MLLARIAGFRKSLQELLNPDHFSMHGVCCSSMK